MNAFNREEQNTATRLVTLAERRRQLVEEYGYLVKKVARRMGQRIAHAGNCIEVEDLYAVGIVGLFDAEARYDASTGHTFETFAEFRIKGEMLDELRRRDFMPRRLRVKSNRLEKATRRLHMELGRKPTAEELAQALEISIEDFEKLRREVENYRFVPVDDCFDLHVECESAFQKMVRRQEVEIFATLMERLSERERMVLDLYFFRELNLKDIGEILGVTEGRVSQIKTATIAKMRKMAAEMETVEVAA